MTKPLVISHSGQQRYIQCPREYQLHYIERLRPTGMASALLFGTAIDKACEDYMKERVPLRARQIFKEHWKEQEHNGQLIELSNCTEIEYRDADFDAELLLQSDNELIIKDTVHANVSSIIKEGKDKERIAYANWISLYRKGILMVNKFIEWVDENVAEVLGCQIPIELEDEDGNKVTGFADFVIKINGYDNPVLVDLKTAARYYERNSVKESEQLSLYFFYLKEKFYPDMERAAYLVLQKQIKKNRTKICKQCGHDASGTNFKTCNNTHNGKRCGGEFNVTITPECNLQYIHDEIPQDMIDNTIQTFNLNVGKIQAGHFEPCFENCLRYNGKIKCAFYEYCRTGSMEGLIKKET